MPVSPHHKQGREFLPLLCQKTMIEGVMPYLSDFTSAPKCLAKRKTVPLPRIPYSPLKVPTFLSEDSISKYRQAHKFKESFLDKFLSHDQYEMYPRRCASHLSPCIHTVDVSTACNPITPTHSPTKLHLPQISEITF